MNDMRDFVNQWADQYIMDVDPKMPNELRLVMLSAFKAGAFKALVELAKAEATQLIEKYTKGKP